MGDEQVKTHVEQSDIRDHATPIPIEHIRHPFISLRAKDISTYTEARAELLGVVPQFGPPPGQSNREERKEGESIAKGAEKTCRGRTDAIADDMSYPGDVLEYEGEGGEKERCLAD